MDKDRKKTKHVFSISELAAQLDISPRTIRFYEQKGLINPRRTPGNQRVYTSKDRARLKLILRGKRFGFSLDEIAEMIGMADTDMDEVSQIRKSLDYGRKKLNEIRDRMKDLIILEQDLLAMQKKLETRLKELTKEEFP
ncbi:MAG: MerR family transcriptional regulator [Desulfosoma sp.]|uniref:MerR family transcriptional regulator n=1 Tax=Desulfosoma sp. TaxID=2603217 RepID=UPI00404AABDD